MSFQLLTTLSPPTPRPRALRSLCSPQAWSRSCRFAFRVGFRSGLHLTPSRVRQCIRPYRVHHFLNYGLVIRFRLLPTPSLDDAVAFSYGQPVLCPMGTSTPLLVRTFRRTRDGLRAVRRIIPAPRRGEKWTAQMPSLPCHSDSS